MARDFVLLMARYNQWMNDRLYTACTRLTHQELTHERGAFFGSIMGTLNHIAVGDTIWLYRFSTLPGGFQALRTLNEFAQPTSLRETLFTTLTEWHGYRAKLDAMILLWAQEITSTQLAAPLTTTNMAGVSTTRKLGLLVLHFFNHQTHHRGQIGTLLFQMGVDVGETDLLNVIPIIEAP
jgi:uncharacterized damage-inducible protein DinB